MGRIPMGLHGVERTLQNMYSFDIAAAATRRCFLAAPLFSELLRAEAPVSEQFWRLYY